jgi:hypothetical protein
MIPSILGVLWRADTTVRDAPDVEALATLATRLLVVEPVAPLLDLARLP